MMMMPMPALLSQDQGSTLVLIFQQCAQVKRQHVPSSTAWQPTEDRDLVFMGIIHEDSDDIQEVSAVNKSQMVPKKHQRVVQKIAQNVTQNVAQSTSKVGQAAVYDAAELDLIQSCLGKPVTLTDAEDSPVKVAKWKKKYITKEQDQSQDRSREMSSESDSVACHSVPNPTKALPESGSNIHDAIKKQAIIESEHQRCRAADYFFVHNICTQLGLPSKDVNQDDMLGYLTEVNEKWKE